VKDPKLEEPLQLEIDWTQPEKPRLDLGEISDPDLFDVGVSVSPQGLVIAFPSEFKGLLFSGEALSKLLFVIDSILHAVVGSPGAEVGEASDAKPKKVTLH
jgi:hypothetical protein